MPEISPAQRDKLLSLGYDPDWYNQESSSPEESLSPPIAKQNTTSSTGGAYGRSIAANALPTAAGGASFAAASGPLWEPALAAAPETYGLSLLTPLAVGTVASLLGGGITKKGQDYLLPDSAKQQLQQDALQHPTAVKMGALTTLPLGGLSPNAPNVLKAGGTLANMPGRLLSRIATPAPEMQNLMNVGSGALLNPAVDVASSVAQGQPMPTMKDILESSATGALFNKPNIAGRLYGFHPPQEIARNAPQVPTAPFEDITSPVAQASQVQGTQNLSLPTASTTGFAAPPAGSMQQLLALAQTLPDTRVGNVNTPKAVSERINPPSTMTTAEKGEILKNLMDRDAIQQAMEHIGGPSQETAGKPEQIVNTPEKTVTQPTQQDLHNQINEVGTMANNEQLPIATRVAAQEQLNSLRQKVSSISSGELPQPIPQAQPEPLIKPVEAPIGSQGGSKVPIAGSNPLDISQVKAEPSKTTTGFYSSQVPAESSVEKAMNKTLKFQSKEQTFSSEASLNDPSVQSRLAALAKQHGVKIAIDKSIGPDVAGQIFKNGAEDTIARLNPQNAGIDTPHHEILHALFAYMKSGKDKGMATLASKGEQLHGGEEPFIQQAGESGAQRFNQPKGNIPAIREWYDNFKQTWKYALGHANKSDLSDMLSYYLVHDTNTKERFLGDNALNATPQNQPASKEDIHGGAESQLTPEQQQESRKNNSREAFEALNKRKLPSTEQLPPKGTHINDTGDIVPDKINFGNDRVGAGDRRYNEDNGAAPIINFADEIRPKEVLRGKIYDHSILGMAKDKGKVVGDLTTEERIEAFKRADELIANMGLSSKDQPKNQAKSAIELGLQKPRFTGEKTGEEKLPYSSIPGLRPLLDVIRKTTGEQGNKLADAVEQFYIKERTERGKFYDSTKALNSLSKEERDTIYKTFLDERRGQETLRDTLPSDKLKSAYDTIRETLLNKQKEQIAAKEPVIDFDNKGKPFAREAKIDPHYFPNIASSEALDILLNHPQTPDAKTLQKDFIKYNTDSGLSEKQAQDKLDNFLSSFGGGKRSHEPIQTRFGANRLTEGVGLPDSWLEPDINRVMDRYSKRVAKDRAWYDSVESSHDLLKMLGSKKDAWLNPVKSDAHDISGNASVKELLDSIQGGHEATELNANAIARVATAMTLGPATAIHIAGTSPFGLMTFARPDQIPGLLHTYATKSFEGIKHAFQTGYAHKDVTFGRDFLDASTRFSDKMNILGKLITKISGREHLDYFTKGLLQAGSEFLVDKNIALAKTGDKTAIDLLQGLDKQFDYTKPVTQQKLQELASTMASYIHGDYNAKNMPGWMLKEGFIGPFFKLASWNISQTNHFARNVLTPATKGNLTPLLMNTLGAIGGGALVKYLREQLQDKKSPIPSLSEIAKTPGGIPAHPGLTAYNLAAMTSYGGLMGIVSQAVKSGFDTYYKNKPQGAMFPLDEVVSNLTGTLLDGGQSLLRGDGNTLEILPKMMQDIMQENIQMARLAQTYAAKTGIMPVTQDKLEYAKKERDLRAFRILNNYPYQAQEDNQSNPYMELGTQRFKRTQDLQEAAGMVPSIIQRQWERSGGDMMQFMQNLRGVKNIPYETMPNMENNPLQFARYIQFVRDTQGADKAQSLLMDYYKRNTINKIKGAMVP